MKKVLIALSGVFGLLLLAALIVPFVVDVDKYRTTIESKVNERLNGKLELGKLALSLWGRVNIDIDGLKLTDANGLQVVSVSDASFRLPLLSLLSGRPEVRIQLDKPNLNVVKLKSGKLNVMGLLKEEAPQGSSSQGTSATPPAGTGAPAKAETEVPAMVMNARFTFLVDHAKLAYKDQLTGDTYNINDLNVRLEDVSPSGEMPFEVTAVLDLTAQQKARVIGPVSLLGSVKASGDNRNFDKAALNAKLKLDGAEITYPGLFHKNKGVALGADAEASVSQSSFSVPKLRFRLADITVDGRVSGKTEGDVTTIDFKASSNQINLAKLGDMSPLVIEYGLNGVVQLAVSASGPLNKLGYGADVKFDKVELKHESLLQPLSVNGALEVATNQIRQLTVKLAAPKDFDVAMSGSMQNFSAPRFQFKLTSNVMDLDGLMKASAKAADNRKEQAKNASVASSGAGTPVAPTGAAPVVDYNAMFEPLRKIPAAAAAAGTFDFSLKKVKTTGVQMDSIQGQVALSNLLLSLKDFSMRLFEGSIKGGMSFNVRGAKPEVGTNLVVAGLQTQRMLENSMPLARNTVRGVVGANLNIGGVGLNQSDITSNWKGNGALDIRNAVFSTLDLGRQIKDVVIDKLPPVIRDRASGKLPDNLLDWKGEYETVGAKFALASGVMNINEINGKAYPNRGMDLKGNGTIRLADYGLDMTLILIDVNNWLKLDEHARDPQYGHFALMAKVGNTLLAPRFDWGASISKLAENALKTEGKRRLEEEAKKRLGDKIPGLGKIFGGGDGEKKAEGGGNENKAQPKPADAVNNVLKGLFGR